MLKLNMLVLVVVLMMGAIGGGWCRTARDSYLDAYRDSHGGNAPGAEAQKKQSEFYPEDFNNDLYAAQSSYETKPQYGPPSPAYIPSYPLEHYHQHYYKPPPPPPPPPAYGMPHALETYFEKFLYKLDILTILKVILKLLIFKKIVLFIGLICLLLFIPAIKERKQLSSVAGTMAPMLDDEEARATQNAELINNLTSTIWKAIGDQKTTNTTCTSPYCQNAEEKGKISKRKSSSTTKSPAN